MSVKILYVEDDLSLAFVTRDNLEQAGFSIFHCSDGETGLKAFQEDSFDLCLLDIMLAELDGFGIAREIRKSNKQVPIIFLTARLLKEDRIQGFEIGADDYVTKPYSIEELILRIKVFLKRSHTLIPQPVKTYTLGSYEFDYENLSLSFGTHQQRLTQREAELLKYLIEHKNTLAKRSAILESVWGEDDYFYGRSMDVFISKLRKYLKQDPSLSIENIHGIGFKFKAL